jgi:uncharacterized membrane protein YeaQ/YmgE (transglycosylase-associated protein family)
LTTLQIRSKGYGIRLVHSHRHRRWLACRPDHEGRGFGLIGDLIVGVVGALLGGFLFGLLGLSAGGLLGQLITATVGAIILIALLRLVKRGGT